MLKPANRYVYHGAAAVISQVNPHQAAADGALLYTTRSVNVARRYGPVVSRFIVNDVPMGTMSVHDWLHDICELSSFKKDGCLAVTVTGSRDIFDFPVDMVVVLDVAALTFDRCLSSDEIVALRDDLSDSQPDGPAAVGWDIWLADLSAGDVDSVLELFGWDVQAGEI